MADDSGSDAPKKAPPPEAPQPSFDSAALLAEFDTVVGNTRNAGGSDQQLDPKQQGQAAAARTGADNQSNTIGDGNKKAEPTELVMTDPFAGADSLGGDDLTRGVKAKKKPAGTGAAPDLRPPADSSRTGEHGGDQNNVPLPPQRPAELTAPDPMKIVGRPGTLDPSKPTVAFLDNFNPPNEEMDTRGNGVPHGEISARAAEQNGFNVFRLQENIPRQGSGFDFAAALKAIEAKIDSKELPLGKGDVLNISMGNFDLKFDEASRMLQEKGGMPGFTVTAENLAANKDRILDGLRTVAANPASTPYEAGVARRALETNEAIKRLQDRGITVVHAAGNSGDHRFSIDFMNAKVQLGSFKPDGTADGFSANHSLVTKGDGVFGVVAHPLKNLAGPGEVPGVRLLGTNTVFSLPGAEMPQDLKALPRNTMDTNPFNGKHGSDALVDAPIIPGQSNKPNPLIQFRTGAEPVFKAPRAEITGNSLVIKKEDGADNPSAKKPELPLQMRIVLEQQFPSFPQVSGVIMGTSFANIRWLAQERENLARIKNRQ